MPRPTPAAAIPTNAAVWCWVTALATLLGACAAPEPASIAPAATTAKPPSPPPPPPTVPAHAADLLGATPATVEALLGKPNLRHADGEADVWLYASHTGCRLDIIIYREAGEAHVLHAAARTPSRTSEANCLRVLHRDAS